MKDTQKAIDFLRTKVRKPDKNEWKKLRRLLGYQKQTIKLPQILQADRVNAIKWWVDASYTAHDNMQGHTGGTMSMVKDKRGLIICIPKKQKLKKNLERGITNRGRRRDSKDAMDKVLPGSARIQD